jgi:hypothetical protein
MLFWDRRLRNAVLCTHGETIGRLFAQLTGQRLVTPEPLVAEGFGLAAAPHRLARVHARYLSPLALDRRLHTG